MPNATNPHEAAARAEKLLRLSAAVDRLCNGTPALKSAIPDWLRSLPDSEWARLAVVAAVRPPGPETRRQLIDLYEVEIANSEPTR